MLGSIDRHILLADTDRVRVILFTKSKEIAINIKSRDTKDWEVVVIPIANRFINKLLKHIR